MTVVNSWKFVNNRSMVKWLFLGSVLQAARAVLESERAHCLPQHVHLSLGEAADQVVVVWATNDTCSTHVEFGTSPWDLGERATGASVTFTEHNLQGLHVLHRVNLIGLKESTTYYYRAVSQGVSAGPFYFRSLPHGNDSSPEVLVTAGLSLQSELPALLGRKVLSGQFSAVLSPGPFSSDMSGANGTVGDEYLEVLQPAVAFIPFLTAPGENDVEGGQYSNYRHRFSMPGSPWPMDANNLWYSFRLGPVHFVSYSTEVLLESGDVRAKAQKDWLENDLSQANKERDKRPWIVAFGYRPLYCTSPAHHDCASNSSRIRTALEDVFYYYGVDIVLQFHENNYERLFPTLRGVVLATNYSNPRAPTHIVFSSTGSKGATAESSGNATNTTTTPPWSAFRIQNGTKPAYGRLQVVNASHAHWEFKMGEDDSVLDSVWIVQEDHGKFELDDLPSDLGKAIDHTLEASGGKPGHLNVRDPEKDRTTTVAATDDMTRLIIGASFGGFVVALLLIVAFVKLRRRRPRVTRRWDSVDYKYGKTKLYTPANDELDDDKEEDNDFEVDIPDGTLQTAKLINGK